MGPGAGISSPPAASRGEVEAIVETLSRELDEIAATLTDTVHEHLSELDEDMRPWTLQAARSNLGVIVTMMREGDDPRSVQPPPEAIGYTKEYVVRDLELSLMQRAYRTAQGVFGGMILERLRAATDDPDHLAEAMTFFNAWIFAWVEAIERRLTDVYMGEHEEWVRGAVAVRAAEVRALLAGAVPADAAAVSLRLGYELDRFHVGFVVWSEESGERPGEAGALFARMERAATAVARSLGAGPPLTVSEGRHLACWAGRATAPDLTRLRLSRGAGRGLSVAAGTPAHGVEGFVLSHHEALLARRVSRLRGSGAGTVAAYPELSLEALLADDLAAVRRFAARELGELAAGDDATVRLASTLAIFLEEGSSFVAAARRLGVHPNTVAYRVRRAESRLGRPLGERQLELRVALRLARLVER
ncbi:MAG TPA: helix-turn-helix domain-containing protein [Solirubrobacterales bacterium]|nr:helix-turn-helix domain-containing protein [Solirubrobacterales bacterium]